MVERRLSGSTGDPWEDVAVEWSKPRDRERALLAYGQFDYEPPAGADVIDVTSDERVDADGVLRTECCHTYRISAAEGR